jgi:hypothetical protein
MNKQQRDYLKIVLEDRIEPPAKEMADALRAAVALFDKLPKTADGVPIVPHMMLWNHTGKVGFRVHTYGGDDGAGGCLWYSSMGDCVHYAPVYSTRERAEIAHHLANGPHDHDHLEGK